LKDCVPYLGEHTWGEFFPTIGISYIDKKSHIFELNRKKFSSVERSTV
jgi:hypothetical protein